MKTDCIITPRMVSDREEAIRRAFTIHGLWGHEKMTDFYSKVRYKRIVWAREDVAGHLRSKGYSYPEIGAMLNRPHTTALYLVRRFNAHACH